MTTNFLERPISDKQVTFLRYREHSLKLIPFLAMSTIMMFVFAMNTYREVFNPTSSALMGAGIIALHALVTCLTLFSLKFLFELSENDFTYINGEILVGDELHPELALYARRMKKISRPYTEYELRSAREWIRMKSQL